MPTIDRTMTRYRTHPSAAPVSSTGQALRVAMSGRLATGHGNVVCPGNGGTP